MEPNSPSGPSKSMLQKEIDLDNALNQDALDHGEYRNRRTINRWLPIWFANMRRNGPTIENDFLAWGDRNAYRAVPPWFKREGNGCALILGSGPSLNSIKSLGSLLSNWKGLVVAGASNATVPAALGRYPDVILAVDSSPETWMQLRWGDFGEHDVNLITNPYIDPKVLTLFPPKNRFYYKSFIPYQKHPLNWYLTMFFQNLIQNFQLQAGCTANAEILWTAYPEDEQGKPLIKKLFLLGTDFGYPENEEGVRQGRAAPYRLVQTPDGIRWIQQVVPPPRTRSNFKTAPNGVFTDEAMLGYKQSCLTCVRMIDMQVYDCSSGIITELPKHKIEEVLSSQGECATDFDRSRFNKIFFQYAKQEGMIEEIKAPRASAVPAPGQLGHAVVPSGATQALRDQEEEAEGGGLLPRVPELPPDGVEGGLDVRAVVHIIGDQSPTDIERSSETGSVESHGPARTEEESPD